METLLLKHKRHEQNLKARAEEISALEATAHSLHQSGHPETRSILARCQGLLLRYPWLWDDGNWVSCLDIYFPSSSLPVQLLGSTTSIFQSIG